MIMNIVSRNTFTLSDVLQVSEYEINIDGDYNGKSTFVVPDIPKDAEEDDFIIFHDGEVFFYGIVELIENEYGCESCTITALEMPKLFDQKIVLSNESMISSTGIEDFIKNQIEANFISSNDSLTNLPYLTVTAKTHTLVDAKPENDQGIYNLCTYLGNALTSYGIFIDFKLTKTGISITLEKKSQEALDIDTGISDVTNVDEVYSISALTKLTVLWQQGENGTNQTRQFFLKTDRSITENINDPDRAKGSSDVIFCTSETEAEMVQEAKNMFTSNSYQHKIEFDVIRSSFLIPESQLYVGHKCRVKSRTGIKDSMIHGIIRTNNSSLISVTLGQLKITLIDKLKGVEAKK